MPTSPTTRNYPEEIIRLAYEQKVALLIGLDQSQAEESYSYYLDVISTLCQILATDNLKPIILKGIGLSQNYPNPPLRGAGDIDLFILDENDRPAADRAISLIASTINPKIHKEPHHYNFEFKGIEVEIHYDATNAYWRSDDEAHIVTTLRNLIVKDYTPAPDIPNAYLPSATFNALFLLRHTFGHFYTASCNLRQFTDWVTFLDRHHNKIDWQLVDDELTKSGMKPFADGLNTMLQKPGWLNANPSHYHIMTTPNDLTERFFIQDIHHAIPNGRHLHQRIRYYYRNRHKLNFISHRHWLGLLKDSILATIDHQLHPHRPLY